MKEEEKHKETMFSKKIISKFKLIREKSRPRTSILL